MRSSLAFLAAVASILVVVATGAGAATSTNLIQNPGAEAGTGGDLPSWETSPGFIAERYGDDQRPSTAVSAEIGGGTYAFAGGSEASVSSGTQIIDVAPSATEIDQQAVSATLGGYLGGVDAEGDYAQVTADFLPALGTNGLGSSLSIGPVTAADRGNQTRFLLRTASGPVPAGTRRIRVTITSTRTTGIYTDGYADNLSLVLDGVAAPSPAPTTTPAPTATPGPTRVPSKLGSIRSPGRRVKGRINVAAKPCKSGRRVVIKKGTKTVGSSKTKSNGSFDIKTKKHKKGKLTVQVRRKATAGTICAPVTKRVPGRN